jgi:hypothetical protein
MSTSLVKSTPLLLAAFLLTSCGEHRGDTSASVQQSLKNSLLVAEYVVPSGAKLADYRPIQVWVESVPPTGEHQIIVRLAGPHHGGTMRVRIADIDEMKYRGIWSERNGPPYEHWAAPTPLPDVLTLERQGKKIEIRRRTQ